MYEETEYMSSQEQLVAFLDGELSPDETTTLFYELAQNPELQEEMRQHVSIKNTLRHSQLIPPPHLKNSILTSTGLKYGLWGNFVDSTSRAIAILSAFLFNRFSFMVLAVSMLSIGVILFLNHLDTNAPQKTNTAQNSEISKQKRIAESANIPLMESSEINNKSDLSQSDKIDLKKPVINQNNNSNSGKSFSNGRSKDRNLTLLSNDNSGINSESVKQSSETITDNELLNGKYYAMIDKSNYLMFPGSNLNNNNNLKYQKLRFVSGDLLSDVMQNTTFYIRKFNATSFPDFNINNETNPLINDINFGFKYNFDSHHSLGIAGGIENFRMSFDKDVDGIIYRYNQSWNGGWIGLNYSYNFGEISNSGIRPELSILSGFTATGPIFRSGVNLNYYITESFYFNTGLEAVLLAYRESQTNSSSKWYSTSKVGFNIGFGVGF